MSSKSLAIGAALAFALAGCSHATPDPNRPAAPVRDRNIISLAELQEPANRDLNVLELVQRLRPFYLINRGPQSAPDTIMTMAGTDMNQSGKVHASIDGISILSLNDLSGVYVRTITEIRYLSASAAMQRFGSRAYAGPVILVLTR